METISITTPALLFSAISLILLAYTNRFMGYSSLVRNLYDGFKRNPDDVIYMQIKNLNTRLKLIRRMQLFGALSLLLCTTSMLFLYLNFDKVGTYLFALGLTSMMASLSLSIWEIQISTKSLEIHLHDMEMAKNQCELPVTKKK